MCAFLREIYLQNSIHGDKSKKSRIKSHYIASHRIASYRISIELYLPNIKNSNSQSPTSLNQKPHQHHNTPYPKNPLSQNNQIPHQTNLNLILNPSHHSQYPFSNPFFLFFQFLSLNHAFPLPTLHTSLIHKYSQANSKPQVPRIFFCTAVNVSIYFSSQSH